MVEGDSDSPQEMKFCTRCGNGIEDEIVRRGYCPFCGAADEGRRFCPDCGASLHQFGSITAAEPEVATEVSAPETYGQGTYEAAAPEQVAEPQPAADTAESAEQSSQSCPDCGNQLYYVQQYNQWYCYSCKGYKQAT